MSKNKQISPDHYDELACEVCEGVEGLAENRFNQRVICTCCLDVIRAIQKLGDEKEDYYTEDNYNELIKERNA